MECIHLVYSYDIKRYGAWQHASINVNMFAYATNSPRLHMPAETDFTTWAIRHPQPLKSIFVCLCKVGDQTN